jgi:hypothetical protein
MALSNSKAVLSLYKVMLRESEKFVDLNYRSYAMRRVKDGFRSNARLVEESKIKETVSNAKENLEIIKRQTTVGQLFGQNRQLSVELPKQT